MKRLITFFQNKCGRSAMTLLLLFTALSGLWAEDYIYLWESGSSGVFYPVGDSPVQIYLNANSQYGFLLTSDNNFSTSTVWGASSDEVRYVPFECDLQTGERKDCNFRTSSAGKYTFTVTKESGSNPKVKVTAPQGSQTDGLTSYYIHYDNGTPNWGDVYFKVGGSAKIYLEANKNYQFGIKKAGSDTWYTNGGTINSDCSNWDFYGGSGNCTIHTGIAGIYTFNIELKDGHPVISVTYPTSDESNVVYYISSNNVYKRATVSNGKIYFNYPGTYYDVTENSLAPFSVIKRELISGSEEGNNALYKYSYLRDGENNITTFNNHNNCTIENVTWVTEAELNGGDKPTFGYKAPEGKYNDAPYDYIYVTYDMIAESLTLDYDSRNDIISSNFYLIVPEENVGNTERAVPDEFKVAPEGHKAFRIWAGRERNQSFLNSDLTALNLKIDFRQLRYDDNGQIKFYIQKGKGEKYFQPTGVSGDDELITGIIGTTNGVDKYGIRSHDMSTNFSEGKYYIIDKSKFTQEEIEKVKSLSFFFSEKNGKHTYLSDKEGFKEIPNGNAVNNNQNNGNLIVGLMRTRGVGSQYYENHIKDKGVYLVGSITSNSYEWNKSHPMTPKYWKNRSVVDLSDLEGDVAKADSIVYEIEIKKGDNSWDNFYLGFTTGDQELNTSWNRLLRPHVQSQMDGQSLEGGVFFFKDDDSDNNGQQSLNPLLTEGMKQRYSSYKVYLNVTYSTYRIEFLDNFCIAGSAVNGQSGDNNEYLKPEYRHAMAERDEHGVPHYVYTGHFVNGGTFAFFVNSTTYTCNYSEDVTPLVASAGSTTDAWSVQAPVGENAGGDYAYHNRVRYNTNGREDLQSPLGTNNNTILWTLPTGDYTLRFYNHKENNVDKPMYTIDKVVTVKNATSEFAEGEGTEVISHNYGGWRTFSDDCAHYLPEGLVAYYVNGIDQETGKVMLKEVENNIIPAHCGVLIYSKNQTMEPGKERYYYLSPVPYEYTKTLAESETNLLVDLSLSSKIINPVEGDNYNYFLTCFYYKDVDNKVKSDVPFNFWKTIVNAEAKKNYTYLSVPKDINPVAFESDIFKYALENSRENVANNARSYCFILSFGDFDNQVITDITSVSSDKKVDTSDVWYTIQGVKTTAPVVPGIYICNGKKIIIK